MAQHEKPEARRLLHQGFQGRVVTPQNLSEWRKGGYREWELKQEALEFMQGLEELQGDGADAMDLADLPEKLAGWVALQYAAMARSLLAEDGDPVGKRKRLRVLSQDVMQLLRGRHSAQQRSWSSHVLR